MIICLILLGIIVALRFGSMPGQNGLGAVLGNAHGTVRILSVELIQPGAIFGYIAHIPAEIVVVALHIGDCLLYTSNMARNRLMVCRTVRSTTLRYVLRIYHSILSTGIGSAFISTDCTMPLLIRMTRSAMAARAELCVMTITVLPIWRQVA